MDDGILGHGGCTILQIFDGVSSGLTEAIPIKKKSDFPKAFKDFIRLWGAPLDLFSDGAWEEASEAVQEIFRLYNIGRQKISEPYYQHQNPAERKIQDLQRIVNGIMDRTPNARACEWLLCTLFCVDLFNHLAQEGLGGMSALERVTGSKTDVSCFLDFTWRQPVYYAVNPTATSFPSSKGQMRLGLWMGPALDTGDVLTYSVLDVETDKIVKRSVLWPADNPKYQNFRANAAALGMGEGEETDRTAPEIVKSLNDYEARARAAQDSFNERFPKPTPKHFSPEELPGLTFLRELPDGQKVRAKVIRKIEDLDAQNHTNIKFLLDLGDGGAEEIIS